MNRIVPFILAFCISICSYSQGHNEIYGSVVIQNSKTNTGEFEYVPNVSISSESGYFKSQITDSKGYFKIICSDKLIGENIDLKIEKEGYEVINEASIEMGAVVGSKTELRIVMAKKEDLEIAYFNSYKFLKEYFVSQKKYNKLGELKNKEIDSIQQANQSKLLNLMNSNSLLFKSNYDKDQIIEKLARDLAYTDLDDLSESLLLANRLMTQGNFKEARDNLSSLDFEKRFEAGELGTNRNNERINAAENNNKLIEKSNRQNLKILLQRSRLEMINNNFYGAIKDLELGLSKDENNVDYLMEMGYVYQVLNNRKCIKYYDKALKITDDDFTKSSIYNNKGVYFKNLKLYDRALKNLLIAAEMREDIYKKGTVLGNYVYTLSSLALLYEEISKFNQSIYYHKKALKISKNIYDSHGSVMASTYFTALTNYTIFLGRKGEITETIKFYGEIVNLIDKGEYLSSTEKAIFYNNYGRFCYQKLDDNQKAYDMYSKGIVEIEKNLPDIYTYYSGTTFDYKYETPILLAYLYRNLASTTSDSKRDIKNQFFVRSMKIYFPKINSSEKNGIRYVQGFINIQMEYALFLYNSKNEKDKKLAREVVSDVIKNVALIVKQDEEFIELGPIYRDLSIFYMFDKSEDKALQYANLDFKYYKDDFKKRPQIGYYELLQSAINLSNQYLLSSTDNNNREKVILKNLSYGLRKFKKFAKQDDFHQKLIERADSIMEDYKNGIEFGEPKKGTIQIKY